MAGIYPSGLVAIRSHLERAVTEICDYLRYIAEIENIYRRLEAGEHVPGVTGRGRPQRTAEQYAALDWRTPDGEPVTEEQREAILGDTWQPSGEPLGLKGPTGPRWRELSRKAADHLRDIGATASAKDIDELLELPDEEGAEQIKDRLNSWLRAAPAADAPQPQDAGPELASPAREDGEGGGTRETCDEYRKLAAELLGVKEEDLHEQGISRTEIDWGASGQVRTIPNNIGDLTDEDDEDLAARMAELLYPSQGITAVSFLGSDEFRRLAWMKQALRVAKRKEPGEGKPAGNDGQGLQVAPVAKPRVAAAQLPALQAQDATTRIQPGDILIRGGDGGPDGPGRNVFIHGGDGGPDANGGAVVIQAGNGRRAETPAPATVAVVSSDAVLPAFHHDAQGRPELMKGRTMNYRYLVNTLHSVNRACTHLAMPSDEAQDDEVFSLLGWFWASHDRSQFLLDSVPPDALKDLSTIAGKPWVLATRRALDALADCLRCTRPLDMQGRVYADLTPAERADALGYWGTTDVEVWIALRDELRQHFLTLKAIRGKHYPGWSGGTPDAPPPDSPPEQPDPTPQDAAAGGDAERDAYRELAKWAADNLKGKQRRAVELLAENNGKMPMADLNLACEWHGDEFARCKQHVNKRLRKAGWLIERHDNEARLRQVKGRQK